VIQGTAEIEEKGTLGINDEISKQRAAISIVFVSGSPTQLGYLIELFVI
jgi:hypothetical protein